MNTGQQHNKTGLKDLPDVLEIVQRSSSSIASDVIFSASRIDIEVVET